MSPSSVVSGESGVIIGVSSSSSSSSSSLVQQLRMAMSMSVTETVSCAYVKMIADSLFSPTKGRDQVKTSIKLGSQ